MVKVTLVVWAFLPLFASAAGELVLSFNPSMEAPAGPLAATADGGFLASAAGHLAKYRADGALSTDFRSGLDDNSNFVHSFIVPDGRGNWFVGGWAVLNDRLFNLAKLRANGSVASEFAPVGDTRPLQTHTSSILSITSDGLGGCYVGGTFTELNLVEAPGLAHIDDAGNVTAISRPAHLSVEAPKHLAVLPSGLLVVQDRDAFILTGNGGVVSLELPPRGPWWSTQGVAYDPRFGLAISVTYFEPGSSYDQWIFVWDSDGRLDPTFKQVVNFNSPFLPAMRWDSVGRLIGINARIGTETGETTDDGQLWGMKRLLRDGSLDPTWSRTLDFDLAQSAFCELANGDLLVSGAFTKVAGHDRTRLVRLRGSNDSTFSAVQQSTRGWVDGNRQSFILGLVIPDRGRTVDVLIRAMSSSLRKYGVNETVFATQFSVYRGQSVVTTVTPNDTRATIADFVGRRTGAFPSEGGNESRAVVSLAPGAYTVIISPIGGEKGEALGEIYFPN